MIEDDPKNYGQWSMVLWISWTLMKRVDARASCQLHQLYIIANGWNVVQRGVTIQRWSAKVSRRKQDSLFCMT